MRRRLYLAAVLASLVAVGARADGANSGAPDPEIQIGPITTFASEAAARIACGRDGVVWADRYAGYVYFSREPQYGHTAQGSFACMHDAVAHNYWSTGPLGSMGHQAGRSFPYTPLFVGS